MVLTTAHAVCGGVMVMPAAIDFVSREIGWRQGTRVARVATGSLMGLGFALVMAVSHAVRPVVWLAFAVWIVILQFTIACLMRRAGKLDAYILKYEHAVRTGSRCAMATAVFGAVAVPNLM